MHHIIHNSLLIINKALPFFLYIENWVTVSVAVL